MTIGPDIKEVLREIGTPFTIIRAAGNVTGEYLYYKTNRQVTKPFVREFFLEATFQHDSVVESSDVIAFISDTRVFLVAVMTPRNFEGQNFDQQCTILKCNVSGELLRQSGNDWNEDYQREITWLPIQSNCYGVLTEELFGNIMDSESPAGQMESKGMLLFVPSSVGVQPLDRYVPTSGEAYKVEEVERRVYTGVDIAHCELDERQDIVE